MAGHRACQRAGQTFGLLPLKFCHVTAPVGSPAYRRQTDECARANYQLLDRVRCASPAHIDQPVHEFLCDGVRNWRCTRHLAQRLHGYVNQLSRNQRYVELYPEEFRLLTSLPTWMPQTLSTRTYQLVQLGWNANAEVCKVGLVTCLPTTQRWLFLCLGADLGVKTMYVTPTFKHRAQYAEPVSVTQVQWDDLFPCGALRRIPDETQATQKTPGP